MNENNTLTTHTLEDAIADAYDTATTNYRRMIRDLNASFSGVTDFLNGLNNYEGTALEAVEAGNEYLRRIESRLAKARTVGDYIAQLVSIHDAQQVSYRRQARLHAEAQATGTGAFASN